MSTVRPTKRRRLGGDLDPNLTKPFVSPLKINTRGALHEGNVNLTGPVPNTASFAHSTRGEHVDRSKVEANPLQKAVSPAVLNSPRRGTLRAHNGNARVRHNPAEQTIQRSVTKLEMKLRALHTDLDVLQQAANLQSISTDSDLEELSTKWRQTAQNAADELFVTVKARVERMGGVTAWRESEQRKHSRLHDVGSFSESVEADDADCEFDSQGEELPEAEQQWRKAQKKKVFQEAREAADDLEPIAQDDPVKLPVWQETGDTEETFTMYMMLRFLNIEADLIGYDKQAQRWIS